MPRQNLIPYALMLALTLLALGAAALAIAQGPATVIPAESESVSVVCTTTPGELHGLSCHISGISPAVGLCVTRETPLPGTPGTLGRPSTPNGAKSYEKELRSVVAKCEGKYTQL